MMQKSVKMAVLREALYELVRGECINQDEQGGCVFCGGSGKEGAYGYCTSEPDCHMADCPWIAGRALLGLGPEEEG